MGKSLTEFGQSSGNLRATSGAGILTLILGCAAIGACSSDTPCEVSKTCAVDGVDAAMDSTTLTTGDEGGAGGNGNDNTSDDTSAEGGTQGTSTSSSNSTSTAPSNLGCQSNADCGGLNPRCGSEGDCEPCSTDDDDGCSGTRATCSSADGTAVCVECGEDSDCEDGTCEVGVCVVPCESNDDCGSAKPVCSEDNECVECASEDDCSTGAPLCNSDAQCVECESNADCDAEAPECSGGTCVCPLSATELATGDANCGTCGNDCTSVDENATCEAGTCVVPAECGDGHVEDDEECDDGDDDDANECTNNCTVPECGNGVREGAEACDDGDDDEADGCTTDCTVPGCGDEVVEGDEECDDGNNSNLDECTNACKRPECGNGVTEGDEECDEGDDNDDEGTCTTECQDADCGDGLVQPGEECDDGDSDDDDQCSNSCLAFNCTDTCFCKDRNCAEIEKIAVGASHRCALSTDGDVWCWGDNASGQLGQTALTTNRPPQRITAINDVVDIDVMISTTCAVKNDGSVWCWGYSGSGSLGDNGQTASNTTTPVRVRTGASSYLTGVTDISATTRNVCTIRGDVDGTVWCWGNRAEVPAFVISEVAAQVPGITAASDLMTGDDTAFAKVSSSWFSWGGGTVSGQTGASGGGYLDVAVVQGSNNFSYISGTEARACGVAGGDLYCWYYLSPFTSLVDLDENIFAPYETSSPWPGSAVQVALGYDHICVLASNSRVYCTGGNSSHQLGTGSGSDVYNTVVQPTGVPATVTQIDGAARHTCALTSTEEVWCWGDSGGNPARVEPVQD